MSTVLFFVMVGVLAVYGLCQCIVGFVAWLWLPKDEKSVTLVYCEKGEPVTPFVRELWEEKEGHPVLFWSETGENGTISLSKLQEILLFLSK